MIYGEMTPFRQRLEGVKPLLILFFVFVLLLLGAVISFRLMRKYQKDKEIRRVFYLAGQDLIINKPKCEMFFLTYLPIRIKFAVDTIEYVEIGYAYFRKISHSYMTYVRIIRKSGRKSSLYWFHANMYEAKGFFTGPVKDVAKVKQMMNRMADELKEFHIPYKIKEEERDKWFM